jgi:hypothetical protein
MVDAEVIALVERGDRDAAARRWRSAVRCYRGALELDLMHRETVARIVKIATKVGNELEWIGYARAITDPPLLPRFQCRIVRVVAHDAGSVVQCAGAGAVIELLMTQAFRVEAHPVGRFAEMPLAMALIILRRALWPVTTAKPDRITVAFGGRSPVWLDARGDWAPA